MKALFLALVLLSGSAHANLSGLSKHLDKLEFVKFALETGVITGMTAKNLCSCVFVQKLPEKRCLELSDTFHSNLVVTPRITRSGHVGRVEVTGKLSGRAARLLKIHSPVNPLRFATSDFRQPQFGCTLQGVPDHR